MSLISQAVDNILNGVSQVPPAQRLSSHSETLENALLNPVAGLRKRPPSVSVGDLAVTHTQQPHQLATGVIALWQMDEASGVNVADSTGTYPLVATNGPTIVAGQSGFGNERSFDGTDDYLTGSADAAARNLFKTGGSDTGWTIAGWVNISSLASATNAVIALTTNTDELVGIYVRSTGKLRWQRDSGASTFDSTGTITVSTRTHIAVTWTNADSKIRLYINGAPSGVSGAETLPAATVSTQAWFVGCARGPLFHFPGTLDSIVVYSKALSAADVSALYTGPASAPASWSAPETLFHPINRTPSERYLLVATDGGLAAYDALTGDAVTVLTPEGDDYLTTTEGFKATTVGDYTFLVNKSQTVSRGTTQSPAQAFEALIFVRQADFSTSYSVTLNGITVSLTTTTADDPASRGLIGTDAIAEALLELLEANSQLDADFTFTLYGSTIHVTRTDGADFTIAGSDGLADGALKVLKGSVQSVDDLPARAKDGMIFQVAGEPGTAVDDFWVTYEDAGQAEQAGVWRESAEPGTIVDLDAETMPWAVVRNGSIISDTVQSPDPAVPTVSVAAPVEYIYGWAKDPDSATTYTVTSRNNVQAHGAGFESAAMAAGDGTVRFSYTAAYDLNLLHVDEGDTVRVDLATWNGAVETVVASQTYDAGIVYSDQTLSVEHVAIAATDKLRIRMYYGSGATPTLVSHRGSLIVHSTTEEIPGVVVSKDSGVNVTFVPTAIYPKGVDVTVTVNTVGFTHTPSSDSTGTQVATALKTLVDAHGTFSATDSGGVLTVWVTTWGSATEVTASVDLDHDTIAWNEDLGLTDDALVGYTIRNITDGSSGTITDNGTRTIAVAALTGGVDNSFEPGDELEVVDISGDPYFVLKTLPWASRVAGPLPSFVDSTIDEVFFHANRLGFTSGEKILMSAAGDLFRFTRATATDLLDDDPIDIVSTHKDVAKFDHAVPWAGDLWLFSGAGHQFRLSGSPVLSPKTVKVKAKAHYPVGLEVRPLALGEGLIFTRGKSSHTQVQNLYQTGAQSDDGGPAVAAVDITQHVPKYLSGTPRAVTGDAALGFLATLTDEGLFIHNFSADAKQAAWSTWTFGGDDVLFVDMYQGVLSLVVSRSDGAFLETIDLGDLPTADDTHQDRQGHVSPESYTFTWTPTRLMVRDEQGQAKDLGRTQVRYLKLRYFDARAFTVTVTPTGRPAKTYTFTAASPEDGVFSVPILCQNTEVTISITNTGSTGCAFSGFEWEGFLTTRTKRI